MLNEFYYGNLWIDTKRKTSNASLILVVPFIFCLPFSVCKPLSFHTGQLGTDTTDEAKSEKKTSPIPKSEA